MALLTDDQLEALGELLNLGMGQATSAIAQMFDAFVTLSVPSVSFISPSDLSPRIEGLLPFPRVCAVRQGFHGAMPGEAVTMYAPDATSTIAALLGIDDSEEISGDEVLLEICNIYVGTCLNGITHQMNQEITFYPPVLMGREIPIEDVFGVTELIWKRALLTEISLDIEDSSFSSKLLIFLPEASCEILAGVLDEFIESLE